MGQWDDWITRWLQEQGSAPGTQGYNQTMDMWNSWDPQQQWLFSLFDPTGGVQSFGNALRHWETYGADSQYTAGREYPGTGGNTQPPPPPQPLDPNMGRTALGGGASVSDSRGYEYDKGQQMAYAQAIQAWIQGGKKGPKPTHYSQGGSAANNWGVNPPTGTTDPPQDGQKKWDEQGGPATGGYMEGQPGGGVGGTWVKQPGRPSIQPPKSDATLGDPMTPAGSSLTHKPPGQALGPPATGGTPGLGTPMTKPKPGWQDPKRKRIASYGG